MWQIAQRDYKFGKGKHRSLTKATYDAIGDHFRSLWGKEAGWAHSVLFTADLRAFSERLSIKMDVKQELIKAEEDANSTVEMASEVIVVTKKRIKSEFEEEEKTTIKIEDAGIRRVKRRRGV